MEFLFLSLSNVFRYVLESREKEVVDFATDKKLLKSISYLNQIRYEDSLQIKIKWFKDHGKIELFPDFKITPTPYKEDFLRYVVPEKTKSYTRWLVAQGAIMPDVQSFAIRRCWCMVVYGNYTFSNCTDFLVGIRNSIGERFNNLITEKLKTVHTSMVKYQWQILPDHQDS